MNQIRRHRPKKDEPISWIVMRRRGGWNAEPEVVSLHDTPGEALLASCSPRRQPYDPPADETDVFTCHAVMPSLIVTEPYEVRS